MMGVGIFSPYRLLRRVTVVAMIAGIPLLVSCAKKASGYRTFADYPGFREYFGNRCEEADMNHTPEKEERELLKRFRPRLILSPGGRYPIDFYRDYLPYTVMRRFSDREIVAETVTPDLLRENRKSRQVYLEFQLDRYRDAGLDRRVQDGEKDASLSERKPAVYGRVYRERVSFPCENEEPCYLDLTFLKYNVIFSTSGLASKLPGGYEFILKLLGLNPDNWHDLDNFVAIHVVLDRKENPIAALLAQHNHHRTYLIGKDIELPLGGRMAFDVALRSNEVYPASDSKEPALHRVVQWSIYMKYLLSGKDPPRYRGLDVTRGLNAGGVEIDYDLTLLSPCDPLYSAEIMLGKPRPFFGKYIGRDGPPGSDYYTIPGLLPLGNLLKFSYLRDGDPEDIALVDMEHGGRTFYRGLMERKKGDDFR
jgi:hypothetical protein